MQQTHTSRSPEGTETIGAAIAARLHGGEVIELSSDLGGGKTTLVRGLVAAAGSTDRVASPTFTISKVYEAPRFTIHHFDFYRLPEAGLIRHELEDVLGDPRIVTIIEWSDIVADVLPKDTIRIHIKTMSETEREILIIEPETTH
ncbi:tRNA (adenosine(37)-N6)-threonylcarbamoyltransferase complex ATPase subunit type 1 TsaE [Candidatus Saccharibacteria bacterium]|nr:tRNA (adenosine(37)-N6)-threonylcarbamoyltransferase complex ATPase subunit type 1 TsaE [Candidatus Saccharibacteria bacterium]